MPCPLTLERRQRLGVRGKGDGGHDLDQTLHVTQDGQYACQVPHFDRSLSALKLAVGGQANPRELSDMLLRQVPPKPVSANPFPERPKGLHVAIGRKSIIPHSFY